MAELVYWGDKAYEQIEMEIDMVTTENNCVGCPMGCIHCGKEHEVVYICDECGERAEELYGYDGDAICIDCLKEKCRI